MRTWLLLALAVAAVLVLAVWKVRVMVAGGKALLVLAVLGGVAWLVLTARRER